MITKQPELRHSLPLTINFDIPAYWTPEQALAAFKLLDDLHKSTLTTASSCSKSAANNIYTPARMKRATPTPKSTINPSEPLNLKNKRPPNGAPLYPTCVAVLCMVLRRRQHRVIHYYRCLGSDAWRRLSGPVCDNRPVRQDLLDDVVWTEIVRLLEQPRLIDDEINRRLAAARESDPTKRREETLLRQLARIRKSMDRLLTAYQEGLISLDELRQRMPDLRRREQADNSELQAITDQSVERAAYLRPAQSLTTFLARLRASAWNRTEQ